MLIYFPNVFKASRSIIFCYKTYFTKLLLLKLLLCYFYNCLYYHWVCHNRNLNAHFKVTKQYDTNIVYFILVHTIIHHFGIFYVERFSYMFFSQNNETHFIQLGYKISPSKFYVVFTIYEINIELKQIINLSITFFKRNEIVTISVKI